MKMLSHLSVAARAGSRILQDRATAVIRTSRTLRLRERSKAAATEVFRRD
jgi:hypothetical protein